jgi:uncharacterized protein
MKKERFEIINGKIKIPAILWGDKGDKLFIGVHGNLSNKEDDVIRIFAEEAVDRGYQLLSFDLPKHGERKESNYELIPQNCINDLSAIYKNASGSFSEISLFGCSFGVYFCLLAYKYKSVKQSIFLSPVISMYSIIQKMMNGFNISEEKLEKEGRIILPIGEVLDWEYYSFVKDNPVSYWDKKTDILYGSKEDISDWEDINNFVSRNNAGIDIFEGGEHYFHTAEQLEYFKKWCGDCIL